MSVFNLLNLLPPGLGNFFLLQEKVHGGGAKSGKFILEDFRLLDRHLVMLFLIHTFFLNVSYKFLTNHNCHNVVVPRILERATIELKSSGSPNTTCTLSKFSAIIEFHVQCFFIDIY